MKCYEYGPKILFTPIHFLRNLQMGQSKLVLQYSKLEMIIRYKNSSLLGPFVSYKENEVLWIWCQNLIRNTSLSS